ncbi:MAG: 5-(carboxyamino)imidazole ribonucleotide mutase [Gammaproteobacteria bacterium]|nr:5-(carboxyamino)imidazole ribonucleotide mutase [Gammaproteobacteria bacterium]NNE04309.1 5-(carboxyamino)imidazole ribonucleotide mutase [Xanthomonadales bacterium]
MVGVIMGSHSDWEVMRHGADTLDGFGIPNETRVISAHRTPDVAFEYASTAEARGIEVIIAGAGMAAALPGVLAAKTTVPVLGVPILSSAFTGLDALLSIVQMPPGIPVGTLAVGKAGAINAAFLACSILGLKHPEFKAALEKARQSRREAVLAQPDPRKA